MASIQEELQMIVLFIDSNKLGKVLGAQQEKNQRKELLIEGSALQILVSSSNKAA